MSMTGMEQKRKGYKAKLIQLFNENPDMPEENIVGLLSGLTGLSHSKIRLYIEELKSEKKI